MKNNIKKIMRMVLGVSLLSTMACTALAADSLINTLNTTSVTSPTTSSVDVKTNDTSVSTTDTSVSATPTTSTVTTENSTTVSPTTSTSLVSNTPLTFQVGLGGGDTTITGIEHVFIKVNQPVHSVEVFLRQEGALDAPHLLGTAIFDAANDRWVYTWDSANRTPDGTYLLLVRAMVSGVATPNSSKGMKVVVANNEKVAVVAPSSTSEYLRKIEEGNKIKLEEQKNRLSEIAKTTATQNENNQPVSEQRILPRTGVISTISRPSKLTPAEIDKAVNENSQKLKDAIDQGDTKKENAVVAEIVRVAQGNSAQADPESTRKIEEGVAKLKQVLIDQTHGVVDEATFKVESVKVAEVTTKPDGTQTVSKIEFRGKALPNSFVTVYIFSIPTVVTVKTDSEGNWNYTLDKELDNGNHQVYVGLTDVKGKVVVKSNPLPFVKTASAITVEEALAVPQAEASPSFVQNNNFYGIVTIIILVLISVFIFLGFKMSKNPNNPTE